MTDNANPLKWYSLSVDGHTLEVATEGEGLAVKNFKVETERANLFNKGSLGGGVGVLLLALEDSLPFKEDENLLEALSGDLRSLENIAVGFVKPQTRTILCYLSYSIDTYYRRAAAEHPLTPTSALMRLAKDRNVQVVQAIASNPATPMGALEALCFHPHSTVRSEVAARGELRGSLKRILVKDESGVVRESLAKNPNCGLAILKILAKDSDVNVKRAVLMSPLLPSDLVIDLGENESEDSDTVEIHKDSVRMPKKTIREIEVKEIKPGPKTTKPTLMNIFSAPRTKKPNPVSKKNSGPKPRSKPTP